MVRVDHRTGSAEQLHCLRGHLLIVEVDLGVDVAEPDLPEGPGGVTGVALEAPELSLLSRTERVIVTCQGLVAASRTGTDRRAPCRLPSPFPLAGGREERMPLAHEIFATDLTQGTQLRLLDLPVALVDALSTRRLILNSVGSVDFTR